MTVGCDVMWVTSERTVAATSSPVRQIQHITHSVHSQLHTEIKFTCTRVWIRLSINQLFYSLPHQDSQPSWNL